MSDYPLFSWTPVVIAIGSAIGVGFMVGFAAGRITSPPTLSTMEAVVDRSGMRWSREDTRSYCSTAGYLKPPFESTLVDAEVLPARDGADVGTLVCYWRLER